MIELPTTKLPMIEMRWLIRSSPIKGDPCVRVLQYRALLCRADASAMVKVWPSPVEVYPWIDVPCVHIDELETEDCGQQNDRDGAKRG